MEIIIYVVGGLLFVMFLGFRIVRPIQKGLVERFGKYTKTADPGLHWIIPFVDKMTKVNITEQMVDIQPQMVITQDKLNAEVDAVVYYQIKNVKASEYNVNDHRRQLTSLARTTLRAVIGKMTLTDANENRDAINIKVEEILTKETQSYGVEVLRVEIQKIEPPQDVQDAMNKVVKAEQEKIAARDIATALETKADGERRAAIKKAEGIKEAKVLEATGEAEAIKLVNSSIREHFKDNAIDYKKLETAEKSFAKGTKYVIDAKSNITNVISDVAGVIPVSKK